MPVHIFNNVTDWLVESGNVKEEEKEIYDYGYECKVQKFWLEVFEYE